jgi:hypothetical protein
VICRKDGGLQQANAKVNMWLRKSATVEHSLSERRGADLGVAPFSELQEQATAGRQIRPLANEQEADA